MKEQLISFETAKLAKEKGFNVYCEFCFKETKEHEIKDHRSSSTYKFEYKAPRPALKKYLDEYDTEICSAPTQSLLQKWLREKKNIIVLVQHGTNPNNYYPEINNVSHLHNPIMWGDTYEEALEVGLIEALKLIELNDNRTDN